MAEPVTKCGACLQSDDHPKHQIMVGFNNVNTGGEMFHEHDFGSEARPGRPEGMIYYHFDCPTEWHDLHSRLETVPPPDATPQHIADCERNKAVADQHQRTVALAKSGVHGDELRARIMEGNV